MLTSPNEKKFYAMKRREYHDKIAVCKNPVDVRSWKSPREGGLCSVVLCSCMKYHKS